MQTAVVNVKVNPEVKKRAQKRAEELGLTLSALINGFLTHLIKSREVHFTLSEEPSDYLIACINEAEKEMKTGGLISFKSGEDALRHLDKMIEDEKRSAKN